MADVNLSGEIRSDFGKGFARRIRMDKKVPAVLYSKGQTPLHFIVDAHDAELGIKKRNAVFELDINGDKKIAIVKDVQKHVFKPILFHIDFIEIVKGEKIRVEVPVRLLGDAAPHTLHLIEAQSLEVLADPLNLPDAIEIDINGKVAGDSIHAGDIELPSGIELRSLEDTTVVIFQEEKAEETRIPAASEDGEAEEEKAEETSEADDSKKEE